MTKKNLNYTFTIFSILCFFISIFLFLIRFNYDFCLKIFSCIRIFRPDLNISKISKLHSFIECNIFLFFIYGISFLIFKRLSFASENNNKFKFFYSPKLILNNKQNLFILIIFLLISIIRFYWISQKKTFHMDELYGISIFHYNEYGLWSGRNFDKLTAYTGKQIKDLILFDNGSVKDTIKDLVHLWIYNRDTAYNNLFFIISRIWYTGFETSDFKSIFWRASILNFIFFVFSFYYLLLTINLLTKNTVFKLVILLASFINPASIGLSIFIRSYALQETLLILFTYLFVMYIKGLESDIELNTKTNFIKTTIVLWLIINCDYFSMIYVAILGLILIIYTIKNKKFDTLYLLICSLLAALVFSKLLYLNWGVGFFTGRGKESFSVLSSFSNIFFDSLKDTAIIISNSFVNIFFLFIISLLNLIIYMKKYKKLGSLPCIIFISAFAWCYFVIFLAPYHTLRYIASIFPILLIPMCIEQSNSKIINISLPVVFLAFSLNPIIKCLPIKSNAQYIEHLDDTDGRIFSSEFIEDTNHKVYIDRNSLYTEILPYLADEQIYYFVDSLEELKNYELSDDYCYYIKYEDSEPHEFIQLKIKNIP